MLPWREEEEFGNLRRAMEGFKKNQPFAVSNTMLFASVASHYLQDAHQPLHASNNYDGQLTEQNGVHARFETRAVRAIPVAADDRPRSADADRRTRATRPSTRCFRATSWSSRFWPRTKRDCRQGRIRRRIFREVSGRCEAAARAPAVRRGHGDRVDDCQRMAAGWTTGAQGRNAANGTEGAAEVGSEWRFSACRCACPDARRQCQRGARKTLQSAGGPPARRV